MDYITDGGEHMEIPRATTDALVERTLIYRCDECGGCYHLNTGATWEAVEVAILKIDPDAACCGAESPEGYRCTRRPDHGGNHLACGPGGLDNVAEEWAP